MKSKTLEITYNILYNEVKFDPEMELQLACWNDSEKIYTDYDDVFFTVDPAKDIKNKDLVYTADDYSNYKNRTSTWEVEYKSGMSKPIENLVKLFQFDQDIQVNLMMDFDLEKLGDIEIIKIGNFYYDQEPITNLKNDIINLLKKHNKKISVSDINAFLKHKNIDQIKEVCEKMYNDGEIDFSGNGRYFILNNDNNDIKSVENKISSDPVEEIRKYAKLYNDGIITEEEFQTKKKKLLGQ